MNLVVNGERRTLADGLNLQQALDALGFTTGSFAVAVNLEFVPRGDYAVTVLKDGDAMEVVAPRQGG